MTYEQKDFVVNEIAKLLKKTSQNKLANMAGISAGYMSQINKRKWKAISTKTWLKVVVNLGIKLKDNWNVAETKGYLQMFDLIKVARRRAMSIGVAGDAGFGKTEVYKQYCKQHKEAYHIECDDYWTKKMYVENFLRALGEDPTGLTSAEMCKDIILKLKSATNPIVFIDEIDKLGDAQILFFISLFNKLDGHCCFVISGSPFLEKRVKLQAKRNKRGYQEFFSRIGRRFINPQPLDLDDTTLICKANGVDDTDDIWRIYKASENDIRRIKREVLKLQELKLGKDVA